MFSSAHRETRVVRLRAELAATREEARRLNSEFHQAASSERPAVELAAAAVPEEHPRLQQDTAYLRSLIDHRRPGVIKGLLQGKAYLLDEYVRIAPNQTALTYAMAQDQDQGMQDIIAVLREAASESADGV